MKPRPIYLPGVGSIVPSTASPGSFLAYREGSVTPVIRPGTATAKFPNRVQALRALKREVGRG